MVKGTQDGETFQLKKVQEIFSDEKIMCENCQSHRRSCIMIPTLKRWVWTSPLRCIWENRLLNNYKRHGYKAKDKVLKSHIGRLLIE